jgi:hypothetical protein
MKYRYWIIALIVTGLTQAPVGAQSRVPPPLPEPIRSGQPGVAQPERYEVQTRGPVHEAFLEPTDTPPQPRLVPQPPPAAVQETPPQERPDGGVVWVSGYWAWDDERAQHVWVSGCWRVPPPGHVWLPGRWQQARGGWQWVPGAWMSAEEERVELLPPPPAPQPESAPQLAAGQIFVPGTWVFQDGRYSWRPGFPLDVPAGWVWSNARYLTTPAGALFVEGHWDLPVQERGLLFAPVAFRGPPTGYVPRYAIAADALLGALFVNARTNHYYYGDYFAPQYRQAGYVTWDQYRVRGIGVNPLYGYYSKHGGRGWAEKYQREYAARSAGRAPFDAAIPLDQFARQGGQLRRVAPDEWAYYQQTTRGYSEAAQHFARYEQEFVAGGQPLPDAPVALPFQPWAKGHPHGMPPGQAKKYQVPGFPVPGHDGKGKKKDKK